VIGLGAMPVSNWLQILQVGLFVGQHSALRSGSPQAARIEWLYWFIFWICFAVYVVMIAVFSRSAIRNHVRTREMLPIFRDDAGDRRATPIVAVATGITILALFVVLWSSVVTGREVEHLSANSAITIDITGHQWWWEVKYPNSQPDLTINTANEIHVPVGTPVTFLTHSYDVIHSFWAPSMNGKRDLIPGYSSSFSFQADTPGIYRGQCAEFCGLQHAHMGFSVIAESREAYNEWAQSQLQDAHQPDSRSQARGREVFLSHSCVLCHTIRGTNAASNVGPDLTHLASRQMIASETLPNNTGALAGWIIDPQRMKPGTQMPPNTLAPDDLQALLSFLESLR
jgi:cytochrome c oxidase subunit II